MISVTTSRGESSRVDNDKNHTASLRSDARSAPVVVFADRTTDLRRLRIEADRLGVDYRVVPLATGSAVGRERLRELEDWTGWRVLPQVFVDGEFVGGIDELFDQPVFGRHREQSVAAARWLGYLGLLPFAAALSGFLFADQPDLRNWFARQYLGYGAVVLSFLGAVQWGVGLSLRGGSAQVERFVAAVLPALAAWASLPLAAPAGATIQFGAFVALKAWEAGPTVSALLPAWYRQLRSQLTVIVCGLTAVFAVAALVTPPA